MKSETNIRAVKVGAFIFFGLVILISGILAVGNLHSTFIKKIEVTAFFDNVNGLMKGNNVWFSGVKIGTVSSLNFYGESQVRVLIKIDEKAQPFIHHDALVKISTDGLIGNKIVVIYGGTADSKMVLDGDTLGIEKTVSTEELMATLEQNNRNLLSITTDFKNISHKLANGDGTVGKLLHDDDLYNSLGTTLGSLQKSSAHAERLTTSIADFGEKLNRKGTLANDLVTDTLVYKSVQVTVAHLREISLTATDATNHLKSASQNLEKATNELENKHTPIGLLLYDEEVASDLKLTLQNLKFGSVKLDENLRALQDNILLRRYFKRKSKEVAKK
jgi:phospholipid/cholesterol/gamma-HCH transport system substrate-binding protein